MKAPQKNSKSAAIRVDLHEHVTNTIIQQLKNGVVPWHKPWKAGDERAFSLPKNLTTGQSYRGVNILLLWTSAFNHEFATDDWASYDQWQKKEEQVRKGEKGTTIIYFDTIVKEKEGADPEKIPFIRKSTVFNRSQLDSFTPEQIDIPEVDLTTRIEIADRFVANTQAVIEHRVGDARYTSDGDRILMPFREFFVNSESCTATEGYYSTLLHELTHWTGGNPRLARIKHKKFADENYKTEELVAELGAAFLCAEFGINLIEKGNNAAYIASWLPVLQENNRCIFTAASAASKAIDYLHGLQPK